MAVAFDPTKDKSYESTRLGADIAAFRAWKRLGGTSERTLDQYERDLARGALMFPDKDITALSDDDAIHIASQFKDGERRVRVAAWRSFFKWAKQMRKVSVNPFDVLPDFKRPTGRVYDIFTDAETESLCALGGLDGVLMEIMFGTGGRKGDFRRLQLKHFIPSEDPEGRDCLVFLFRKGAKQSLIPVQPRVSSAIAELAVLNGLGANDYLWYGVKANEISRKITRHKAIGEGTFARWWGDPNDPSAGCLGRAGVRYRNPHMTRHTFATKWLRKGGRLETLSMILGHASIKTTFDLYGHLDTQDVLADLAVIEGRT